MTSLAVNTTCPWSGGPVSPDSLTTYQGRVVGFCNPGCRDKFDSAVSHLDQALSKAHAHAPMKAGFVRLTHYNRWMNENLFRTAAQLSDSAYRQDLNASFKSIHGTLNHILVWDTTWLQRFAEHTVSYASLVPVSTLARPVSHDQILYDDLDALCDARKQMDDWITAFILETEEHQYSGTFSYTISTGQRYNKNFGGMLQHLFNHQTHHRGQITTLMLQSGVDPGVTDLLATLPDLDQPLHDTEIL